MPSLQVLLTKKGPTKPSKDGVGIVESLDTKQLIVPIRKAGSESKNTAKEKAAW